MSVIQLPSSNPRITWPLPMPTEPLFPLSIDQYHDMIQAGILTDDDPVELLEGHLVTRMPKKPPHSTSLDLVRESLQAVLPSGWRVRVQEPITTPESEPEPDVAAVHGDKRSFVNRSLRRDRTIKMRIYARARIPFYWIVNLIDRQVEVHSDPTGPGDSPDYRQRQDYGADQEAPVILDGKEVGRLKVADLLP